MPLNPKKKIMKKIYMIAASLLVSSATILASAQAIQLSSVESRWGKALVCNGEKTTTMGGRLVKAIDGNLYMVAEAGTKEAGNIITFGDEKIADGSDYGGTSYNHNFILSKITQNGDLIWTISSTSGEVASNEEWGVATADGGIVVACKARHTQGHLDKPINFVDAKGNNTTLNWHIAQGTKRKNNGLIMKISSEGVIEWTKLLDIDDKPQPEASSHYKDHTPTAVMVYGLTTDSEGNIYVSGRMMAKMTIDKGDGSTVTIEPHNVEGWDGDIQKTVGNAYIVKLDPQGNYITHFVSGGKATNDAIRTMTIKDGKLYGLVMMKGIAGTAVTMGDKSVTPEGNFSSMGVVCMDTDLKTVERFNLYESKLHGSVVNVPCMKITDDNIWLMGQAKYEIKAGNKELKTEHTRDALLLKTDRETGALITGTVKQKNQTAYFDVFEDESHNLYAGTFALFGPLAIEKIDKETLDVTDRVDLFPTTATAQNLVVDGNHLFAMSRIKGDNLTSLPAGSPFTVTAKGFACLVSAYTLPFKTATAVAPVESEKIVLRVEYVNLQGMVSSTPFNGMNVVVTHYSDGSRKVVKEMK